MFKIKSKIKKNKKNILNDFLNQYHLIMLLKPVFRMIDIHIDFIQTHKKWKTKYFLLKTPF